MLQNAGIPVNNDGSRRTGMEILAFPNVGFSDLLQLIPDLSTVDEETRRQTERDALYANYIERQKKDVAALKRDEAHLIPSDFDFEEIQGLSNELKMKLKAASPGTLAQASGIDGMTPAGLALILAHLRKSEKRQRA